MYHLTITSTEELTWDVTYIEWTPNMIDSHLTDQYVKVQDDRYVCPSSDGQVYMLNPTHSSLFSLLKPNNRNHIMDQESSLLRNKCLRRLQTFVRRSINL